MRRGVFALVVALGIAGCSDSATPGEDAASTTTSVAGASTTSTVTSTAVGERDVRFEVHPTEVQAGGRVTISGSGCPAEGRWADETGLDYVVIVGAAVDGQRRGAATVHPPSDDPGHLSFELVPEYDEQRVADATPDGDGHWSTTWDLPDDAATGALVVSALCIGGPGLEAGYVHYGGIALAVQGSGDCPERPTPSPQAFDDEVGTYAATIETFDASTNLIEFDVVQWLSGQDAADAWHEAFPDDPEGPPNDYFIRNENPLVRSAPVAAGADVRLVRLATDGSADVTAGSLAELPSYLAATPLSTFWLSFEAGAVTAICEQYRP